MKSTVQLLLLIHEHFDGTRFSDIELTEWARETEKIWEESSEFREEIPTLSETAALATETFSTTEPVNLSQPLQVHSEAFDTLAVEYLGQEFLFPLALVQGIYAYERLEYETILKEVRTSRSLKIGGVIHPWSRLEDFRPSKKFSAEPKTPPYEVLILGDAVTKQAFPVDRVIGFHRISAEDLEEANAHGGAFVRVKSRSQRMPRWFRVPA